MLMASISRAIRVGEQGSYSMALGDSPFIIIVIKGVYAFVPVSECIGVFFGAS